MTLEPLPPPIPPPGGDVCANCGAEVKMKSEFCPQCGARVRVLETSSYAASCWAALLAFAAFVFGALGTCAAYFSVIIGIKKPAKIFAASDWIAFALMACLWFAIAILCSRGVRKINRKR